MGDASHAHSSLQQEQYRVATFGDQKYAIDKSALAKAGFYYTKKGDDVKCYECNLEINAKNLKGSDNITTIHKEKSPECLFAKGITPRLKPGRSKTFISYDSLRFEKERLETYIDWPIKWLPPADLAADGFYYLRTADHCACVFCRGIVGAWEIGDTPRGEHQRHFPHCPFLRGQPVGNVPISHSNILARLPSQENTPNSEAINQRGNIDICGTPRHMAGSYPESRGSSNKPEISLEEIGLPQYSGPKRKDFLTVESRLGSYSVWPDRVSQKPNDLADAGFFYCGLSDHVRCFHCGNGLRNWEKDDVPWNEHARWYPECSYVLLKKGQDFIDKVRRENPPYIRTAPATKPSTSKTSCPSPISSSRHTVTDEDLDRLMDLDIIRGVLGMGFPTHIVRAALRDHVQETGMPYFSMEPCIEAVLKKMEEETRQTLHSNNDNIQNEATESQVAKIQSINPRRESTQSGETTPSSSSASVTQQAHAIPSTSSASDHPSEDITGTLPTLPPPSTSVNNTAELPTLPAQDEVNSNTEMLSLPRPIPQETPQEQSPDTHEESVESSRMSQDENEVMEVDETGASVSRVSSSRLNDMEQIIMQADELMSMAEEALKAPSSGPPSLSCTGKVEGEGESTGVMEQASTSEAKQNENVPSPQSKQELEDELERMRESRMCKVCMDGDIDVVFLPCAHMIACASCAVALTQCPICRKDIKYTVKPIVS